MLNYATITYLYVFFCGILKVYFILSSFYLSKSFRSLKLKFSGIQYVKDMKGYKFTATNTTFRIGEDNSCFCLNKTMDIDGVYRCFDGLLDLTTCQGKNNYRYIL